MIRLSLPIASTLVRVDIVILRQLAKSPTWRRSWGADVRSDQLLEGIATDRQLKPDSALLGNV